MKVQDYIAIVVALVIGFTVFITGLWVVIAILGGIILCAIGLLLVIGFVVAYITDVFDRIDERKENEKRTPESYINGEW